MNSILPRGRYVSFDVEQYLEENALTEVTHEPSADDRSPMETPA
jgi:hypothetical protein